MGKALIYIANEVPQQKIDAYIILQSATSDRDYIERNLVVLKTVFGEAAPKKAIILVTKAEDLLNDGPGAAKKNKNKCMAKLKGYA